MIPLILIVALILVAFAVPIVRMCKLLCRRTYGQAYDAAEFGIKSEVVNLKSVDNFSLVAYNVEVSMPKGVVICLGGIHSPTVTNWYGHSALLAKEGYASILLDLRAHGASEGKRIYAATEEWKDVDAAVAYIKSQQRYNDLPIVVMGLSMGAATALVATGRNGDIDGVIALSAYSSWGYNFNRNVEQKMPQFVAKLLVPFVYMATCVVLGRRANISPVNVIKGLGARPALLIHSRDDKMVPLANLERLLEVAPNAQTWIREGDNHRILADFIHPQTDTAYCAKIVEFLNSNFYGEKRERDI